MTTVIASTGRRFLWSNEALSKKQNQTSARNIKVCCKNPILNQTPKWQQKLKVNLTSQSLTQKVAKFLNVQPSRILEFSLAVFKFVGGALLAGFIGFMAHDTLRAFASDFFELRFIDRKDATAFETSYFGFVSIVYAILIGNTFAFLLNRQTMIVQELYQEILALEILIQNMFLNVDDLGDRYNLIRAFQSYLEEELYGEKNVDSPFTQKSPLVRILGQLAELRGRNVEVKSMVVEVEEIAKAQSKRLAVSAQILPQIHWVTLYALAFLFISTFLIFETGINNPKEVKIIFSILCGVCTSVLLVLQDLADPLGGMYTFRDNLENRLQFVSRQLDNLLGEAPVPITSGQITSEQEGSNGVKESIDQNGKTAKKGL
eukprot:TRINITY_DN5091_c0_g3_i1.p1 TRINITY_DN5091_c0_g3~~TRINITY_DN5091_c0_g3_i1.p1  ORF type:complete len:374 (-),score=55.34 TRINITY_DN5091_c0_g3_i1:411-1532(-)